MQCWKGSGRMLQYGAVSVMLVVWLSPGLSAASTYNRCDAGQCGISCDKSCWGRCLYACKQNTCVCDACQDGYYGNNCSQTCPNTCGSHGDAPANCKRYTGECKDGCKEENMCSTGTGCDRTCSSHCRDGTCDFVDCKCYHGCVDGHWGEKCDKQCMGCGVCEWESGACLDHPTTTTAAASILRCTCSECLRDCAEQCSDHHGWSPIAASLLTILLCALCLIAWIGLYNRRVIMELLTSPRSFCSGFKFSETMKKHQGPLILTAVILVVLIFIYACLCLFVFT